MSRPDRGAREARERKPDFRDYPHRALWCTVTPGAPDLGAIPPDAALAAGVHPGPVRLPDGVPTSFGYGRLHIEGAPGRVNAMRGLGFSDVLDFVSQVATNWTRLLPAEDDKLQLVWRRDAADLRVVVRWEAPCWAVVTALPSRHHPATPIYVR